MKGKMPAFQFYPGDWRRDTQVQMAEMETRGVWIEMLCCMWDAPERGTLEGAPHEIARMLGCDLEVLNKAIKELDKLKIADVEPGDNGHISISNRRMVAEEYRRNSNKIRQARLRAKGGGDPKRWTAIRIPILERDEYMCAYCGRKADTVDHITPKSQGGTEDPSNLVACCKRCNNIKQRRTPEEANMSFWPGFNVEKLEYNTKITPPSSSSVTTSSSKRKKNTKKKEILSKSQEEQFEKWWKLYPRKIGKDAARKAWVSRAPTDDDIAKWIIVLKTQVDSVDYFSDEEKYIPHPSTYLNRGSFDDEVRSSLKIPEGGFTL